LIDVALALREVVRPGTDKSAHSSAHGTSKPVLAGIFGLEISLF